jgi:hypothetical protein
MCTPRSDGPYLRNTASSQPTNHDDQVQSGRPRALEFRGRPCQWQDHQSSHEGCRLQGVHAFASKDDPQYEIKSDKTEHIAMHKGKALSKIGS